MTSTAKKTATRKPTAKKAAAKASGTKPARKPRALHPITPPIRDLGASVIGFATERAMASEDLGVKAIWARELPGKRQGMATAVTLDDGTRISITMVVR